jgi:signal transduction histidine kinase
MWRPRTHDLVIVAVAVALAGIATVAQSDGPAELLFYAVLLAILGFVGRQGLRTLRLARAEHVRAAEVTRMRPEEVALAAVREERHRLTQDITASLRESLTEIRSRAAADDDADVDVRLQRIRGATARAASDLRRHLGLLRSPLPDPGAPARATGTRPARRDVVLAGAMVVLATSESVVYQQTEDWSWWSPWSVVFTALAAASVLLRTASLAWATAWCAAAFLAGSLVGGPVVDGFWTLGAPAVLVWSVAARPRLVPAELAGGLGLVTAAAVTRWMASPDNLFMVMLILGVASASGAVVRLIRARGASAARVADAHERQLDTAARTAVDAERGVLARELHDVTSHAVGVIAAQAGAAEVSWDSDPAATTRALAVIGATADAALAELDRLPAHDRHQPTARDLGELAARIRAAGTPVDLTVVGEASPEVMHVVIRVVQESLTNVVRHAPGARAEVTVATDEHRTEVRVVDDGPGAEPASLRGYGLVGLAERVRLAGGRFSAGPALSGCGFRIEAVLPTCAVHPTGAPP